MKRVIILLCLGVFLAVSCGKQETDLEGFDNIIGCWANPAYEYDYYPEAVIRYERVKTLPVDNSYGIKFLKDGTLTERKLAGWCATPPAMHSNYTGKWQIQNNDEIKIDVAYWGGMEQRTWKIIEVTNTSLRIEIHVENTQYD